MSKATEQCPFPAQMHQMHELNILIVTHILPHGNVAVNPNRLQDDKGTQDFLITTIILRSLQVSANE